MNRVNLLGNVGGVIFDNKKETQHRCIIFSLATSEKWLDSAKNEVVNTTWHKIVAFGKQAEDLAIHAQKGVRLWIEGQIRNQEYNDKHGNKAYSSDVLVRTYIIKK